jgi:hypothetical protein
LKLQLKQPVPSHHIPKTTSTILFCGCEDVGNAAVIVNDEDRVSQPWDETTGLPGQLSVDRYGPHSVGRIEEPAEGWDRPNRPGPGVDTARQNDGG